MLTLERRLVALTTCYDLYDDGKLVATIERDLVSFTPSYTYKGGKDEYRAEGSFSNRRYAIKSGSDGSLIAQVSKILRVSRSV